MHWVQILESHASPSTINYWKEWFDSKGIRYEMHSTRKGHALFRAMDDKEYDALRQMR